MTKESEATVSILSLSNIITVVLFNTGLTALLWRIISDINSAVSFAALLLPLVIIIIIINSIYLLKIKHFRIDKQKVEISDHLKWRTDIVNVSEILGWAEVTTRLPVTRRLTIITVKSTYTLTENDYSNYAQLKEALIFEKPRNLINEIAIYRRRRNNESLLFCIGGIFLFTIISHKAIGKIGWNSALLLEPMFIMALITCITFNLVAILLYFSNPYK